jgi:hypothetical protein
MKAAARCTVCRGVLESAGRLVCSDPASCLRARHSWEWDPCPSARCEFSPKAAKLPTRRVRFTSEGKTRTVWVGPVYPSGPEEHLFAFDARID